MKINILWIVISLLIIGCKGPDIGAKAEPYPLNVCLVTDNKLGSMGDPVRIVHREQEIKFCCKACIKKFRREPAKYLKRLN